MEASTTRRPDPAQTAHPPRAPSRRQHRPPHSLQTGRGTLPKPPAPTHQRWTRHRHRGHPQKHLEPTGPQATPQNGTGGHTLDILWRKPHGTGGGPPHHHPRHIQRAVGPFTVYAVPHPITAQCTQCNPRCALPCAGALQQPLPTPTYRGGIYLGTIPGDPHPYLLPAADRHHAIPLHLVEHLAVGPSPFQKRPPHTPSDGRPPDEPTHATPGPKRAIALLTLKGGSHHPPRPGGGKPPHG